MSCDEITCSELDNTAHKPKESLLENCNTEENLANIGAIDASNISARCVSSGDLDTIHQDDEDNEEYDVDVMTGSYGEISLDHELLAAKDNDLSGDKETPENKEINEDKLQTFDKVQGNVSKERKRPDSLVLAKNSKPGLEQDPKVPESAETVEPWKRIHKSQQTSDSQSTSLNGSPSLSSEEYAICSSSHQRTGSDTSGLSDLPGTVTVDGDMVSFFVEDLQEKIKLSSPVSKWTDSSSYPGSRSSTPSLHRQVLQSQIPLVDASAISDLEIHARKVAACVDTMLENLSGTLQSISSLTVDYMETYESAVCKTCDAVDNGIKTMYQLMAKCEELSNSVKPLYKIEQDIKSIKKALDIFENAVERKS